MFIYHLYGSYYDRHFIDVNPLPPCALICSLPTPMFLMQAECARRAAKITSSAPGAPSEPGTFLPSNVHQLSPPDPTHVFLASPWPAPFLIFLGSPFL